MKYLWIFLAITVLLQVNANSKQLNHSIDAVGCCPLPLVTRTVEELSLVIDTCTITTTPTSTLTVKSQIFTTSTSLIVSTTTVTFTATSRIIQSKLFISTKTVVQKSIRTFSRVNSFPTDATLVTQTDILTFTETRLSTLTSFSKTTFITTFFKLSSTTTSSTLTISIPSTISSTSTSTFIFTNEVAVYFYNPVLTGVSELVSGTVTVYISQTVYNFFTTSITLYAFNTGSDSTLIKVTNTNSVPVQTFASYVSTGSNISAFTTATKTYSRIYPEP